MKITFGDDTLSHPLPVVDAIVVDASAGGVAALLKIFSGLRKGFTLPILMVLHLPDDRLSQLVNVFQNRLAVPV
ncbi:chemotaxis protein CheB, partial [Pseudomonas syringae]|uniref:chemotaxis protein CheB n=1 Tax=Pseudomonas syringae TaxID=317 RepID=UPI001FA41BF3